MMCEHVCVAQDSYFLILLSRYIEHLNSEFLSFVVVVVVMSGIRIEFTAAFIRPQIIKTCDRKTIHEKFITLKSTVILNQHEVNW